MEMISPPVYGAPVGQLDADRPAAALSLRGIIKRFGDAVVLDGIDLEVPPGQFLAVIGKSGCGKSTLLRLLAGLDQPSAGSLAGGGGAGAVTRIMFQEPRLLPWERVDDNVAVGLPQPRRGQSARRRAVEMLEAVGLADRAADWPSVLSGGQKQRVALARALVGHPQILALDEPLGALDALTRIEMQGLLERMWRDQGFTAVLVTHDVTEALMLADRVVVLEGGRIMLDLDVPLRRPRQRGAVEMARLEGRLLTQLLGADPSSGADHDDHARPFESVRR